MLSRLHMQMQDHAVLDRRSERNLYPANAVVLMIIVLCVLGNGDAILSSIWVHLQLSTC